MSATAPDSRATALRAWAQGDVALEAAVDLLVTAMGGRLLDGSWIRSDERGGCYFCTDELEAESGHFSGGEWRVLAIASSLAVSNRPVDLGDAITGLDPNTLRLVLTALAHAGGLVPLASDYLSQSEIPTRLPSDMHSDLEEP